MSGQLSSESQSMHEELEKAKESVSRLRCINGFTPGFCPSSAVCQGCWRHEHDVTIGKCSERDEMYSDFDENTFHWRPRPFRQDSVYSGESSSFCRRYSPNSRDASSTRRKSSKSRAGLGQLHKQINSLEQNVRGPILSYIRDMEEKNRELADAIESVQQQLLKHERWCSVGSTSSGSLRTVSKRNLGGTSSEKLAGSSWFADPEKEELMKKLKASHQAERASQFRADSLEKDLSVCQDKLEKAEARVKDLFRSISQRQASTSSGSSEILLENQLQRQQQLAETYLKESTAKEREVSFLTIEKYNLQSELNSLLSDLKSSNQKRDEISQEHKKLQATLEAKGQKISDLENELATAKSENRRLKSQFRDELERERVASEQRSEDMLAYQKEIKELRKRCRKFEHSHILQKDLSQQLEKQKGELMSEAKDLNNELKIKAVECKKLQQENERLAKEIPSVQHVATLSRKTSENAAVYVEKLRKELDESKGLVKKLELSLSECKTKEVNSSARVAMFSSREEDLKSRITSVEKERSFFTQEVTELKKREAEYIRELAQFKTNVDAAERTSREMRESCSELGTELDLARKKCLNLTKENEELVLSKATVEKSLNGTSEELKVVKTNYNDLVEKNSRISSDLKAYKRIVGEREDQLKKMELELSQLHKAKDKDLKELLRKDKEIAFFKVRLASGERNARGSLGTVRSLSQSNLSTMQLEPTPSGKEAEIYLEKIVELESECRAQKTQIARLQNDELNSKKEAQRSDSLKSEVARQDEEILQLKREISRLNQVVDDLRVKEEQLRTVEVEKEKFRQDAAKLREKVEEAAQLKEDWERREQEIKALRRMSSDEMDLEGKVTRFKDRCREKDEEIEELHKKVISLQVKIKDFVQQNSQAEEQVRMAKEKLASELHAKEKLGHALSVSQAKCRTLEEDVEHTKSRCADLEREVLEIKSLARSLESKEEEADDKIVQLSSDVQRKEEEIESLRNQLQELEEAKKQNEIAFGAIDVPDGSSTPLDNSFENGRPTLSRSGRASALDRLDTLEEENIQLLNRQGELEDELDAAEEQVKELKTALKAKRENANELHAELDLLKDRMKGLERSKADLADENEALQQTCLLSKQKIEDLKVASERYMEESDELEKALTASEKRIEELEKRLEEISGRYANSEGQLQSVNERLARKEKELEVVETQVEEQRKLCDGYKTSAEKQETLIEKLRMEKSSVEENLLAVKLEVAKKEGAYKTGKEKVAELQSRLYETEDKFSSKAKELKKVIRENERLKREIKDLETKTTELQSMMKKGKSLELEKTSPVTGVYNTRFQTLSSSVKGNSQSMEGLDSKLNLAQSKISTLEVELANDLRKFSLQRTSSDVPRRSYSPGDHQKSPGSPSLPRPRSFTNLSADDDASISPNSPIPRSASALNIRGENSIVDTIQSSPEFDVTPGEIVVTDFESDQGHSVSVVHGKDLFTAISVVSGNMINASTQNPFSEADPFLFPSASKRSMENLHSSNQNGESPRNETNKELQNQAASVFENNSAEISSTQTYETACVRETVVSSSAFVTERVTSLASPSMQPGLDGEEELIYF